MLANSILLIMCKCRSGRKTVPQPDQPTHQLTNPTQHEGKEASFMGSMREDGTGTFVVISCAVGPTGVLWSGICWRWALPITNSRWVSCSPTWDCSKWYLIFQTLHQEGTLTAASEGLCCPNTGYLCTKGLIKLQSEMAFLFYIFLCLSVPGDKGL